MRRRYAIFSSSPLITIRIEFMGYIINCESDLEMVCDVCGRVGTSKTIKSHSITGLDLCWKHSNQWKLHGCFLDNNPRSIKDPNQYYINGDIVIMDLYNHKSEVIAQTIFDIDDLDKIKGIKWGMNSAGYVYSSRTVFKNTRGVLMHSLILNTSELVDHKDHNILNNRKSNLRIATSSQNMMNRKSVGVSMVNKTGKYYACIGFNNININLGSFYNTFDEALYARWYAEGILFGEFKYPRNEPLIPKYRKFEINKYVDNKINKYTNVGI